MGYYTAPACLNKYNLYQHGYVFQICHEAKEVNCNGICTIWGGSEYTKQHGIASNLWAHTHRTFLSMRGGQRHPVQDSSSSVQLGAPEASARANVGKWICFKYFCMASNSSASKMRGQEKQGRGCFCCPPLFFLIRKLRHRFTDIRYLGAVDNFHRKRPYSGLLSLLPQTLE